mmetsp:Transcript_6619/g.28225  ORF Transcript_6619/g.28225 Transcript_6619/m.28225 type:complete len:203 (+) Transcript_6619:386-994(+)
MTRTTARLRTSGSPRWTRHEGYSRARCRRRRFKATTTPSTKTMSRSRFDPRRVSRRASKNTSARWCNASSSARRFCRRAAPDSSVFKILRSRFPRAETSPRRSGACSCWTACSRTRTGCRAPSWAGAGTGGTCFWRTRKKAVSFCAPSTRAWRGGSRGGAPRRTPRRFRESWSSCGTGRRSRATCFSSCVGVSRGSRTPSGS